VANRHEPEGPPLVAGSGQSWKVTFGLGAMGVAAVASVVHLLGPASFKPIALAFSVGPGLVGIFSLTQIRCPRCNKSLAVWAFRTGSLTTWAERLEKVSACPFCGCTAARR